MNNGCSFCRTEGKRELLLDEHVKFEDEVCDQMVLRAGIGNTDGNLDIRSYLVDEWGDQFRTVRVIIPALYCPMCGRSLI